MIGTVEKIEMLSDGRIILTISARRIYTSLAKPQLKDYVQEWMKVQNNKEAIKESTERFEGALAAWQGDEVGRAYHNNTVAQLHLGEVILRQDPAARQEPQE